MSNSSPEMFFVMGSEWYKAQKLKQKNWYKTIIQATEVQKKKVIKKIKSRPDVLTHH